MALGGYGYGYGYGTGHGCRIGVDAGESCLSNALGSFSAVEWLVVAAIVGGVVWLALRWTRRKRPVPPEAADPDPRPKKHPPAIE